MAGAIVTPDAVTTLASVAGQTKEKQMSEKTWKLSDLWTDATGKLDEKRIIGALLVLFGVGYLIVTGKLDHFAAIEGFGIGLLGGAVAADQGK